MCRLLTKDTIQNIKNIFDTKPLVIEGANGSIGLSFLKVLKEFHIKSMPLILTTYSSDLDKDWYEFDPDIIHLKASDEDHDINRLKIFKNLKSINVIYSSGYGRPGKFLNNPRSVINSNITNLLIYSKLDNLSSFSYISSSELYSGLEGSAVEDSQLPTQPQNPRGIYIESKRLGESIVENIIGKNVKRYASYRVALAFPPKLLKNDNRVMADLINNGQKEGVVTLSGGSDFIRQYQYGPNCVKKILASISQGHSTIYNNAGSHIVTLGELAKIIGNILNLEVNIRNVLPSDFTAPRSVLINSKRLNIESNYQSGEELTLTSYIKSMVSTKNV